MAAFDRMRPVVLVVDEEPFVREGLAAILANSYAVLEACDGETALKVAADRQVDLMLLDVGMAGLTGLDVLQRLRAAGNPMNVMMMSAVNTAAAAVRAMKLGATDYVTTPFEVDTFLDLIAHTLADHPQRKPGAGAGVLVVGDDLGARASVAVLLDAYYRVAAVSTSLEVGKDEPRWAPDVVVVDLPRDRLQAERTLQHIEAQHPGRPRVVIAGAGSAVGGAGGPRVVLAGADASVGGAGGPRVVLAGADAAVGGRDPATDVILQAPLDVRLLIDEIASAIRAPVPLPRLSAIVSQAVAHVRGHSAEVSVGALATIAGVSPRQLHARFHRDTSMSPKQYLLRVKLETARYLLRETDLALQVIARRIGVYDGAHLSRLFRGHFGMTPGTFRRG